MIERKTLLFVVNVDWFFISHRLCIAKEAVKEGWNVIVIAKDTGRADEIRNEGVKFEHIQLSRSSTNPFSELKIIFKLVKLYKQYQPTIVHQVTLKPIIYGSIALRLTNIKAVVNAISGLGYYFTNERKGLVRSLIRIFLRLAFHHKRMAVIFQNKDDYYEFEKAKILNSNHKIYFIKGAGVDLNEFQYSIPVKKNEKVIILFSARMILGKGIEELRAVTNLLKEKDSERVKFLLCGRVDEDSKDTVSASYIKNWEQKNYVEWIGHQLEMPSIYANSDIVVFPSYREGMPKSLLEACASGKPIVTTDAIGCRDCVDEGLNGYKVPVKSIIELAEAIEKLINSPEDRLRMGKYSREKAEKEFDQKEVVKKHLKIFNSLLQA